MSDDEHTFLTLTKITIINNVARPTQNRGYLLKALITVIIDLFFFSCMHFSELRDLISGNVVIRCASFYKFLLLNLAQRLIAIIYIKICSSKINWADIILGEIMQIGKTQICFNVSNKKWKMREQTSGFISDQPHHIVLNLATIFVSLNGKNNGDGIKNAISYIYHFARWNHGKRIFEKWQSRRKKIAN